MVHRPQDLWIQEEIRLVNRAAVRKGDRIGQENRPPEPQATCVARNIIVIYRDDRKRISYGIQKDYDRWTVSSIQMTMRNRVIYSDDELSSTEMHTKETLQKKSTQPPNGGCSSEAVKKHPAPDPCPHQAIIDLYHEILPELTRIQEWTPARQSLLRTRWKEKKERQNLAWWREFFEQKVRASDFLMGRKKDWQADLEWIIRPKNFPKVLEGKYLNNQQKGSPAKGEGWREEYRRRKEA